MTRRCPGRASSSTSIPIIFRRSRSGRRHSPNSDAPREAANATEVLLHNYPSFTVERHLGNFHWKRPDDIAHYGDGLLKAGVPSAKLTLVESSPKLAADS